MNNIRMIITDLDKSLLDNNLKITEYTKDVFNNCKKNGIIIVFASARPFRAIKIFFESIMPDAVICHNGAGVYINDKKVFQNGIKPTTAKNLLKNIIVNYPKANIAIENNDEISTNFDPSVYWKDIIYKDIDIENLPESDIDKIIVGMESIEKINEIEKYLPNDLYLEISEGKIGLIMNKEATKWNAVKKLADIYKISIENTLAFGDDLNDLSMIMNCGIGVAMENSIDKIKNTAKYICGKNSENGIAKWIDEYLTKMVIPIK